MRLSKKPPEGKSRSNGPEPCHFLDISRPFKRKRLLQRTCRSRGSLVAAGGGKPSDSTKGLRQLPQQGQHTLGQLVGLRHHSGTRLLQDLGTGQVGSLRGEVGVLNPATRGSQVFRRNL